MYVHAVIMTGVFQVFFQREFATAKSNFLPGNFVLAEERDVERFVAR
jgi:hypothetical protein